MFVELAIRVNTANVDLHDSLASNFAADFFARSRNDTVAHGQRIAGARLARPGLGVDRDLPGADIWRLGFRRHRGNSKSRGGDQNSKRQTGAAKAHQMSLDNMDDVPIDWDCVQNLLQCKVKGLLFPRKEKSYIFSTLWIFTLLGLETPHRRNSGNRRWFPRSYPFLRMTVI